MNNKLLQALLKGKLTHEEENMEDLLTSNVFGSIKYVPIQDALLPLLKCCQNDRGEFLLAESASIREVHYQFWPRINEVKNRGCEPDVLITIHINSVQKMIILVEAKYHSGKSSEAIEENENIKKTLNLKDQLAIEWDNLIHLANREKAIPVLLYVTADIGFPKKSIEASYKEYKKYRYQEMNVYWISWRKLPNLFIGSEKTILIDLVKVLKKLGLVSFEQIKCSKPPQIIWTFNKINEWDWSKYKSPTITWKYL